MDTTPRPLTISQWFNGNEGVMESLRPITTPAATSDDEDDDYVGQQQFFATGPYDQEHEQQPDVYGAVIQEPRNNPAGKVGQGHADEFGLLTQILYRKPAQDNDT